MSEGLSPGAQRVQDALLARGIDCRVQEMSQTTRSAADAARAVGCDVGQIAKSLVFRSLRTDRAVLVITCGRNRVDEDRLRRILDEPIGKADADFVRSRTGFAIGGVPPIGHAAPPLIFVDEDLLQYAEIWAAAGTPRAVFKLTPEQLLQITGGEVIGVK